MKNGNVNNENDNVDYDNLDSTAVPDYFKMMAVENGQNNPQK